jgi:hypothetical protein
LSTGAAEADVVVPVVRIVPIAVRASGVVLIVVPGAATQDHSKFDLSPLKDQLSQEPFPNTIGISMGDMANPAMDTLSNLFQRDLTTKVCLVQSL